MANEEEAEFRVGACHHLLAGFVNLVWWVAGGHWVGGGRHICSLAERARGLPDGGHGF